MDRKKLDKILENHLHWLEEDCEGWENMKADLRGADLRDANLRFVEFFGVNLRGANLCDANLYGANLYGANFCDANLRFANLCFADLHGVDFRGADLYKVDLRGASFHGTDLCGAKNIPFIPMACPDKGSFIGYKKAHNLIVELEICEDARRSSATGRKCRCDKAKVISITTLDGEDAEAVEVASNFNSEFIYRVGEIVEEPNFCEDRFDECVAGIHFFINRQEAVDYR